MNLFSWWSINLPLFLPVWGLVTWRDINENFLPLIVLQIYHNAESSKSGYFPYTFFKATACSLYDNRITQKKPTTTGRICLWITMYLAFQRVFQYIFVIPNNCSVKFDYLHRLRVSYPRWKQAHCKALTISRFPQILPHHISSVPQQKEPLYSEQEVKLSDSPDALDHS